MREGRRDPVGSARAELLTDARLLPGIGIPGFGLSGLSLHPSRTPELPIHQELRNAEFPLWLRMEI